MEAGRIGGIMKPIKITVTGSNARVTEKPVVTSGTVGLPVEFTFDEVWEDIKQYFEDSSM